MAPRSFVLNPGEEVVVDVRPHWWYLAGPVATVVVVIAGAAAAGIESAPTWAIWAVLVVLGLALIWLVARYIRWASTRLLVTNTRLIERRGIISRRGREIPLSALTDISYRQTIFDRIIGAGDVLLESAGRDSQEVFPDLPHPARIHNEIYMQMDRARQAQFSNSGSAPAPAPGASIPTQIEQLDSLRQRGLITDAEFETKKAQLLDRL
jgi:uncharacterized membrane protein YdbT with pleckstrin-like domain